MCDAVAAWPPAVLPGLEHQHRLADGGRAQHVHEGRPAFYVLQIQDDDPAGLIRGQEGDDIRLVYVGLIADAEKTAETDAAADRPVYDAAAQRARLRHEGDMAFGRHAPLTKVVFSGVCVSMTPMPLGPITRMP